MLLSLEEVERIAKLARLQFTEPEKQKLQSELTKILDYVDQVQEVAAKEEQLPDPDALNLMRDDFAEATTDPKVLINQAPSTEGGFVKVKSILE